MFGIENLPRPAPLKMRMLPELVHQETPRHAEQPCGIVHIHRDDILSPRRQRPAHIPVSSERAARDSAAFTPAMHPSTNAI